jgi:hypothetical protein
VSESGIRQEGMMKRIMMVLAVLACALLSSVAWADSIDLFNGIALINKYGTVSISNDGISTTGSEMVEFDGIVAPKGHSLGSVIFSTGALMTGSLQGGGTFSSVGSIFQVIGKGHYGQPTGTIFSGSFLGPIEWTLISEKGANLTFLLSGLLEGQVYTGRMIFMKTNQTIVTTKGQLAHGIGHILSGTTSTHGLNPEPGSFVLIGTGLAGIFGVARRRLAGR